MLGISMAAVAEGLSLGQRLGIDAKTLSRIFNTSSARCWSSDVYNPCPVRHTTARFAVGLEALCQQDSWAALLPSPAPVLLPCTVSALSAAEKMPHGVGS